MSQDLAVGTYDDHPVPYFVSRGLVTMLVPDQLLKCAVFIGIRRDGRFLPRATGFLTAYTDHQVRFLQAVTAEHVVSGLLSINETIWCRVNLTNGDTAEYEMPASAWKFHPDERTATDVAVCPLRGHVDDPGHQTVNWDHHSLALNDRFSISATNDVMAQKQIGTGDEICVVGLFRSHFGKQRNTPIVRIGNIALLKGEPVHTKFKGYVDGYLIEAHSIGGLSGSPVFVSMPPLRVLGGTIVQTQGRQFYLLGLMHGHFDIADLNQDSVVEDARDATSGINTGVGVVIPVEKIIETVQHPDLAAERYEVAMKMREEEGATPDAESTAADLAISDAETASHDPHENPDHREDFNSLVGAAAKRRRPNEKT